MLYHPPPEQGQGLLEYALVLLLIAIAIIAVLVIFGPAIGNLYSEVLDLFPS
jgi:pilus assembly protein Flp/PilA